LDKGFFWKNFKPLEQVLWHNAAEYYRLSLSSASTLIHAFNARLVEEIRQTAAQHSISMSDYFDEDMHLRDRIRCFYKNRTNNARKRFATMTKSSPEKNRKNISAILLLIAVKDDEENEMILRKQDESTLLGPTNSQSPPAVILVSPETADHTTLLRLRVQSW
jgi:hypothetical protein